jgi:hypothetical protein
MRTHIASSLLLTLALFATGCRTKDHSQETDFPCICGAPDAAVYGCLHPLCINDERNPDNPDCNCGELNIPSDQ